LISYKFLILVYIFPWVQKVEASLKNVNLFHGGVADKAAGKYSGGMKRRLSVAISLIGDPKVCLRKAWVLLLISHPLAIYIRRLYLETQRDHSLFFQQVFEKNVYVCYSCPYFGDCYLEIWKRLFTWMSQALAWIQLPGATCGML